MTDPITGTSESQPDGGKAGTQAGGTEGGAKGGRTPTPEDLAALAKVHETNLVKERERSRALEAQIEDLRNRSMGATAPPADPLADVREEAGYSHTSRHVLEQEARLQRTEIEMQVSDAIAASDVPVPGKLVPLVKQLIRDSGYRRSVADALKMARGTAIDTVESENAALKQENERLKAEAEAIKSRVRVSVATMPAAVGAEATTISGTDYNAILARGGPEARALMARVNSPQGTAGHIELDLHN